MFLNALFLLAIALLAFAQNQCTRTYTVQQGDICDSISAANNVSTYQLAAVNQNTINSQCDNLVPGSNICLGWQGEDCTTTYVVMLEDTCNGIVDAYGLNYTIFYANNPQVGEYCDNLYVGEVLCIAPTVLVYSPSTSGTLSDSETPLTSNPSSGDSSDSETPPCTNSSSNDLSDSETPLTSNPSVGDLSDSEPPLTTNSSYNEFSDSETSLTTNPNSGDLFDSGNPLTTNSNSSDLPDSGTPLAPNPGSADPSW